MIVTLYELLCVLFVYVYNSSGMIVTLYELLCVLFVYVYTGLTYIYI